MKKTILIIGALTICACLLLACGTAKEASQGQTDADNTSSEDTYTAEQPTVAEDGSLLYTKDFGSYSLPQDWIESQTHSTSDKFFYLVDGTDHDEKPDNISVNQGTCRYTTNDAISFGRSIAAQLTNEVGDTGDVTGSGTYTEAGYPLLKFTITSTDSSVSKQYYIMADQKYCLINLSNYDNSDEADAAAQKIVDSFTWAE